jgi:hypothetical protein
VAACKALVPFLAVDLCAPFPFICDNFLPSAIDRLAMPRMANRFVNIDQLAAADFVGCSSQCSVHPITS